MSDRSELFERVSAERNRQNFKFGYPQVNSPMEWAAILSEESGECVKELNNYQLSGDDESKENALKEAIETAAVAISIIEHVQHWGEPSFGGIIDVQEGEVSRETSNLVLDEDGLYLVCSRCGCLDARNYCAGCGAKIEELKAELKEIEPFIPAAKAGAAAASMIAHSAGRQLLKNSILSKGPLDER